MKTIEDIIKENEDSKPQLCEDTLRFLYNIFERYSKELEENVKGRLDMKNEKEFIEAASKMIIINESASCIRVLLIETLTGKLEKILNDENN